MASEILDTAILPICLLSILMVRPIKEISKIPVKRYLNTGQIDPDNQIIYRRQVHPSADNSY